MATPNMNLTILVAGPGGTPGPQYGTDIINNFSVIDQHDHTSGKGTRIPTGGLNINANLGFNDFALTGVGRCQYTNLSVAPSGAANYRSLSVVSGDLYFLDNSGNSIQITSSGAVNVSGSGNLGGVTGSAGVNFILASDAWQLIDDGGDRARLLTADIRLFEKGATSITNYVGLTSPGSLAATYTLTMPPALPAGSAYLSSNASGVLSFATADGILANATATGANDIIDAYTRPTGSTVAARGFAQASTSLVSRTTNGTTAITGASVTITTSGRPVRIGFNGDGIVTAGAQGNGGAEVIIRILRDAVLIAELPLRHDKNDTDFSSVSVSTNAFQYFDQVSAGTYNYTAELELDDISSPTSFEGTISASAFYAYEI